VITYRPKGKQFDAVGIELVRTKEEASKLVRRYEAKDHVAYAMYHSVYLEDK